MSEDPGDKPSEAVEDGLIPRVGGGDVLPPVLDVAPLLAEHLGDLLMHLPPVVPGLHFCSLLGPLHLAQFIRKVLWHCVRETLNNLVDLLQLKISFILLTHNIHFFEFLEGDFKCQSGFLLNILVKSLPFAKNLVRRDEFSIRGEDFSVFLTELGWRILGSLPGSSHDYSTN